MKYRSNGVPELIVCDEWSKRETLELCSDPMDGLRCMLVKGHAGMHEGLGTQGPARWPSSKAS